MARSRFCFGRGAWTQESFGLDHTRYVQLIKRLEKLPRGFSFAMDVILRHVWMHLVQSSNMLVSTESVPSEAGLVFIQETWDEMAYSMATTWFGHLHNLSQAQARRVTYEIGVALGTAKLKGFYTDFILPKTTWRIREEGRRNILVMIVQHVTAHRLPVELQEYVLAYLLQLRGHSEAEEVRPQGPQPDFIEGSIVAPYSVSDASGSCDWSLPRLDDNSSGERCKDAACCCRHAHVEPCRSIQRWDGVSKRYVQAHRRDFPNGQLYCDLIRSHSHRWGGCTFRE